jgi:hypothetical protein
VKNNIKFWTIFFILIITFLIVACPIDNNQSSEPDEKLSLTFGVANGGDPVVGCTLEIICPTYINNKIVTTQWYKDGVRNYFIDGQRYYSPTSVGSYNIVVSAQGFDSITSNALIVRENDWTLLLKGTEWKKIDNENIWIKFEDAEINDPPRMWWNYAAQSVYFGETLNSRWGNHWGNTITTKTHISFNAIVVNDNLTVSDWTGSFYGENAMDGIYKKSQ